jgi:CYTH domain-containing protein
MAVEIERRFLIKDPGVLDRLESERIVQGYLPVEAPSSVRVRVRGEGASARAKLTIKHGRSALHRLEFEYDIPVADAETLLAEACGPRRVCKRRATLDHGGRTWELDRFEADNAPLTLAEVELETEDAAFVPPPWLGAEVTDDDRLTNVNLASRPFGHWPEAERAALLTATDAEATP